jgi:hypothetical protein
MRQTVLALAILGTVLSSSAGAQVLGWHRGGSCCSLGAPVAVYPYPYAYPYYPAPVYEPYAYGSSTSGPTSRTVGTRSGTGATPGRTTA